MNEEDIDIGEWAKKCSVDVIHGFRGVSVRISWWTPDGLSWGLERLFSDYEIHDDRMGRATSQVSRRLRYDLDAAARKSEAIFNKSVRK